MKQAKIKILIADDHPVVRDGIASIIEVEKDMRIVAQAEDGVETVELAKNHLPDVVLLDLRMPRMDGLEVIAQIQSLQPLKVNRTLIGRSRREREAICLKILTGPRFWKPSGRCIAAKLAFRRALDKS
jgi:DNA-binding NarL/FixJ family response regulator